MGNLTPDSPFDSAQGKLGGCPHMGILSVAFFQSYFFSPGQERRCEQRLYDWFWDGTGALLA